MKKIAEKKVAAKADKKVIKMVIKKVEKKDEKKIAKKTKWIPVSYYRTWWDFLKKVGTIRLYDKQDALIKDSTFIFTDLEDMRDFIALFLSREAPVVFNPITQEIEAGHFPVTPIRRAAKKP